MSSLILNKISSALEELIDKEVYHIFLEETGHKIVCKHCHGDPKSLAVVCSDCFGCGEVDDPSWTHKMSYKKRVITGAQIFVGKDTKLLLTLDGVEAFIPESMVYLNKPSAQAHCNSVNKIKFKLNKN